MRSLRRFLPTALACFCLVSSLQSQDLESLRALIRAQGVSGREANVRDAIQSRLPAGRRAEVDNLGNLVLVLGSGRPVRLVMAAMDEAGFVVTQIRPDGYLRVRRPAREPLPPRFNAYFVGQPLLIGAAEGRDPIPAAGAILSTHLQRGRADNAAPAPPPRDEDLLVDAGARSEAEAKAAGIRLLAPVTLEKDLAVLGGGMVAGFAMDGRAGCEVLLQLARNVTPPKEGSLVLAWAAQSWSGERGAQRLAKRFEADEVLVLDFYSAAAADETGKPPGGRAGRGPFLADSPEKDAASRALRAGIRAKAHALGIPLQSVRFPSTHDGKPFAGRPLAVLGVPVRFPGTPVETVSLDDLDTLIRLMDAYLESLR
ncbi:MAG TPA: hypothetical protein VFW45_17790 [Candidatus Polarisedimenticolia bacterium]|nr:hypothetical protein [Candidatus Polarisedimenticolia bacterium]